MQHSKRLLLAVLVGVCCVPTHAQGTSGVKRATAKGDVAQTFRLEIAATREEHTVKAPVELRVKLRNNTKGIVNVVRSRSSQGGAGAPSPHGGFLVVVKDSQGKPIPYTRYGQDMLNTDWPLEVGVPQFEMDGRGPTPVPLQASQVIEGKLPLSLLVDLSRPGKYFVTAMRRVFTLGNVGQSVVTSNTIQIQVPEPVEVEWAQNPDERAQPEIDVPTPNFKWDKPVVASWKDGDQWLLDLEMYHTDVPNGTPPTQIADIKRALEKSNVSKELADSILRQAQEKPPGDLPYGVERWKVRVEVKNMTLADRDVWSVTLRPNVLDPYYVRPIWRILVDKQSGQTIEATSYPNLGKRLTRRFQNAQTAQVGASPALAEVAFPTDENAETPLEIFPIHLNAPLEASDKSGYRLSISTQDTPKERIVTAKVEWKQNGQTIARTTTQHWVPGAHWWSEYELNDPSHHIILRAKRVESALEFLQDS